MVEEEEEEEEGGRTGSLRSLTAVRSSRVSLKYKVTLYDPQWSAAAIASLLQAKVRSKEFDTAFRRFALQFSAPRLVNGTFGEPSVTNLLVEEDDGGEEAPDVGLIVGVVVGGTLFLLLMLAGACVYNKRRKSVSAVAANN